LEGTEGTEEPAALAAVTVKVYAVPFVRPVTVHDVDVPASQVSPPGAEVTRKRVIGAPHESGVAHDTVARALPAVAVTLVGAPG
jgi:hypothetical protein